MRIFVALARLFSEDFLAAHPPWVHKDFVQRYSLPPAFRLELREAAERFRWWNRSIVLFTAFNVHHIEFALNLRCSLTGAGVSNHLFIALDQGAHHAIPGSLLLDVESRNLAYDQICKLKLYVQYQLLLWGVSSVIVDDDLVVLRDVNELFVDDVDWQVQAETDSSLVFDDRFDYAKFNVGFMRVVPSELAVLVYERWLLDASRRGLLDQLVFSRSLGPWRRPGRLDPVQLYDMRRRRSIVADGGDFGALVSVETQIVASAGAFCGVGAYVRCFGGCSDSEGHGVLRVAGPARPAEG